MSEGEIILGAREWLVTAVALGVVALAVLAWAYARVASTSTVRGVGFLLKAVAIVLLAICLVDPLYVGSRPRPGSNLFLVVADDSRSLQLADQGMGAPRGQAMKESLTRENGWLTRLAQDFDVRRYSFDSTLVPQQDFTQLKFAGGASSLKQSLASLAERYKGQPVAGVLLLTDGNATDLEESNSDALWKTLPPVYPVKIASDSPARDVSVKQVAVSQTNFEAAPVTITAEIESQAISNRNLVVRVLNDKREEVERRTVSPSKPGEPISQRFLIKPDSPGVSFFTVHAALENEVELPADSPRSREATLANNSRLAVVDRGGGPYRVLYVSGSPNWDFKFLRRAISKDDEVDLVGLVRIAKKEPKFTFLNREGDDSNPLFRGFEKKDDDATEQYNEPVLLRLGAEDKSELAGGFPKDVAELYRYHAIILDDVEAGFFTQDQLSLMQQFVSQRGGGLLMMGGKDSYGEGGYARTPIAEALPVYLDRTAAEPANLAYQLKLTREGWLQPWIRVRSNEPDEQQRLAAMPAFRSLNPVDAIKPGASVLAEVETSNQGTRPALVVQPFGRGRVGALMIGDMWRWDLRRPDHKESDLEKSWRQTVRWLVADVPQPVEVETRRVAGSGLPAREIIVRVRDPQFAPLDNAQAAVTVTTPEGREIALVAESSDAAAGEYRATFTPREAGAYRAKVVATAPDGSQVGSREVGWAVEPETEEFRRLAGNQALLERIAADTGGEVVALSGLDSFVTGLPNRKLPHVETWSYPLWHQWTVLTIAFACLLGEWGLRRLRGLP